MNGTAILDMQTAKSTLDFSHTSGFANDSFGTLKLGAAALTKEGVGAIDFNGTTSSAVETGAASAAISAVNNASGFTAMAWIYPRSDGEGDGGRIFTDVASGAGFQFNMTGETGGTVKLEVNINMATTDAYAVTSTTMTINNWHHVAMVFNQDDDNRIKIYIDGALASLTTNTAGVGAIVDDASNKLYIGNVAAGTRTFNGYISGVRIHVSEGGGYASGAGILTIGQIKKIYNSGNGHVMDAVQDGQFVWLRGDEGGGTSWVDKSDSQAAVNFTLSNTAWTNAIITSSSTDNYNFTMTTGTMKVTGLCGLIEKANKVQICGNVASALTDVRFKDYGGLDFWFNADLAAGTMATFTRCLFENESDDTKLINFATGAVSNGEDAFCLFDACTFTRPDTTTPLTIGRGRFYFKDCSFIDGAGASWADPSSGAGKGWASQDIARADPHLGDIVSKNHNRGDGYFIDPRMSNATPSSTTFTAANSTLYSTIPTDYQPDKTSKVGIDDDLTTKSGYKHIFAMNSTNQLFGSLTVENAAVVKMQQESSKDITLYVGALSGTGDILTAFGRVYDDYTSAFEFGQVGDTLNKIGNDLDGDISGAVNNLLKTPG